jgi:hypothetical protein
MGFRSYQCHTVSKYSRCRGLCRDGSVSRSKTAECTKTDLSKILSISVGFLYNVESYPWGFRPRNKVWFRAVSKTSTAIPEALSVRCRNTQVYFSTLLREPTLIDSILLESVLEHSAALLPTHASVSLSDGTYNIMTRYDTGSTKIPFGPLYVCIWVSLFLVQDSPIDGTPHQCPFRGIFAEPLNYAIPTTTRTIINKASLYSPLDSNRFWTLSKVSLQ